MARLWVGISGWSYPEWRGTVYPPRLPARLWLPHYATLFDTVELNVAFYRLLRPADIERWRAATPPGFLFAVKGSRFLTHNLKLANAERALERYFAGITPLGDRAGPVVFQTPPTLQADLPRLAAFLDLLPRGRRFAFEFRHPGWHVPAVLEALRRRNVAFVPFEIGRLRGPRHATADFVYVRLHGRKPDYRGRYTRRSLAPWAAWVRHHLRQGRDAYVYFDNTGEGIWAIRNALAFRALCGGTPPTRGFAPPFAPAINAQRSRSSEDRATVS